MLVGSYVMVISDNTEHYRKQMIGRRGVVYWCGDAYDEDDSLYVRFKEPIVPGDDSDGNNRGVYKRVYFKHELKLVGKGRIGRRYGAKI